MNGTAKTLKTIGIIVVLLCLIGGVILGFSTAQYYGSFNLTVAAICWVSGFISGVLVFAFGEVVDLLQVNADRQAQIIEKLDKMPRPEVQKRVTAPESPKATTPPPQPATTKQENAQEGKGDAGFDNIMQLFDKK